MKEPDPSAKEPAEIQEVIRFWFGVPDADGLAPPEASSRWWRVDPAFDGEIRDRFGALHAELSAGDHAVWTVTPIGRLAYIIVLDQLSRNMYRDTPAMYATDSQALAAAEGAVALGADRALFLDGRAFVYLPFMHSEVLAHQERCVELFTAVVDELDEGPARDRVLDNLRFACAHRDIVARFGRFPHRNRILGRSSTPEEEAFLTEPGSSF